MSKPEYLYEVSVAYSNREVITHIIATDLTNLLDKINGTLIWYKLIREVGV